MISAGVKKWFAFGNGVGIEIAGPHGSESLRISAVRVRPNGARVLGGFTIEDVPHQQASQWSVGYSAFIRKLGLSHVAATVLLPRQDVILRQIAVPGVTDKDLAAAVGYQLDGLHPYAEDDVISSWARLPGTSTVLVAIARKTTIERYAELFAEAGIRVAAFTCTPAAIYSALRLFSAPPAEILALEDNAGRIEVYGESPALPLFSAMFDLTPERAAGLACAELRIDPAIHFSTQPRSFHALLGADPALPYAAALASACPSLSLAINLLPALQRAISSRALWIPSAVFGSLALLLLGALAAFPSYENRRYLRSLDSEIAKVQPRASLAAKLDRDIETARRRTLLLDEVRRRSKADMDVLAEMTRILPAPTWLNMLEITRTQVVISGETDQAAPLLKVIDGSPLFEGSEFISPPMRIQTGEGFRIRTNRRAKP